MSILRYTPAVFAVGDTYQIMALVDRDALMGVRIGDQTFYDHKNGTLRSATEIHRMTVPRKLLDEKGEYTITYRTIIERKPYFTKSEDPVDITFKFNPVKNGKARAYLIADAHNDEAATIKALKEYEKTNGEIDFLILAGDIPNYSQTTENFRTIYVLAEAATKGEKPIAYAKGNHDLRGISADLMDDYSPIENGHSYFTFRLGDIWGISLDCAEDKNDSHEEYGNTVCCHAFRLQETEYIKKVIANAKSEYEADGVKHKVVLVHHPFSQVPPAPFDIEQEIYSEWCQLLRDYIKPELMISGHRHVLAYHTVGGSMDHLGQACPALVGTKPFKGEDGTQHFVGTGILFDENGFSYIANDDMGNIHPIPEV